MAGPTKRGGLSSIEGDRKPDIVKVKCLVAAANPQGFVILTGECNLDLFEHAMDAFYDQGFLDLIDADGMKLRVWRDKTIACVDGGVRKPGAPKILLPANG